MLDLRLCPSATSPSVARPRGAMRHESELPHGGGGRFGLGVALAPGWATNNLWLWTDTTNQVRLPRGPRSPTPPAPAACQDCLTAA